MTHPYVMKRILALLMTLSILLALCACGAKDDSPMAMNPPTSIDPAPNPPMDGGAKDTPEDTPESERILTDDVLGNANTTSIFTRTYGRLINWTSPVMRQNQTLYFVTGGILRKMPVDGTVVDSQGFFPMRETFAEPREIQVVGEWIYTCYDYSSEVVAGAYYFNKRAIARTSLDGTEGTTILKDMSSNHDNGTNTFVVRGDEIYYTYTEYTQTSASQYSFTSGLKRLNMVTGEETKLWEIPVERPDQAVEIRAYTPDTILLQYNFIPFTAVVGEFGLYDFEDNTVSPAPQFKNCGDDIHVEGNIYYSFLNKDGAVCIYRYAPDTAYDQECIYSGKFSQDWGSVMILDGILYAATKDGIFAFENGQYTLVTADHARYIFSVGDGYIYYIYFNSNPGECYRVRLDGSDWSAVDWYQYKID